MTDSMMKLYLDQLLSSGRLEIVADTSVGHEKNPFKRGEQSATISACDRGAPPRLPSRTSSYPSNPAVEIKRSQLEKECQKKLHRQSRWNASPTNTKDSSISPVRRTGSLKFAPKTFPTLVSPEKIPNRTAAMQEVMNLIDDFEPSPVIRRACSA
jgi:hypothetical protein